MPTRNALSGLGIGRGDDYLSLPSTGYGVVTPHIAAHNPGTSTVDLRALVALSNWVPVSTAALIGSWGTNSQYLFYVATTGKLNAAWINAAGAGQFPAATVTTGFAAGTRKWVRALLTIGSGTCDFYSSDDGVAWTAMGTQITGLTTTAVQVPASPPNLHIAEENAGVSQWVGQVFRAQLIIAGVLISDIDFSQQVVGATNTTMLASTGETWTISGPAVIV